MVLKIEPIALIRIVGSFVRGQQMIYALKGKLCIGKKVYWMIYSASNFRASHFSNGSALLLLKCSPFKSQYFLTVSTLQYQRDQLFPNSSGNTTESQIIYSWSPLVITVILIASTGSEFSGRV